MVVAVVEVKLGRGKLNSESSKMTDHEVIRRLVSRNPGLASALERILQVLPQPPGTCIAISGSIARGQVDRYSDIDLWYIVRDKNALDERRAQVVAALQRVGDPITTFPATHLGIDNLVIFFAVFEERVVKFDVEFVSACDFRRPIELIALHDPDRMFDNFLERPDSKVDVDLAKRRATGWIWYTYTKIARGELMEASDALDAIRKLTVVPLQLYLAGVPIEGYRRIESRLEPSALDALRKTYASKITEDALVDALLHTAHLFRNLYVAASRTDQADVSGIDRVLDAIRHDLTVKGSH